MVRWPAPDPPRRAAPARSRQPLDVALVIPLHGPAGIVGPSSGFCAQRRSRSSTPVGVLGQELRLTVWTAPRNP